MIHQPSGGAEGKASDIEISYKEIQRLKEKLNQLLAENTGRSMKEMTAATDRDNFMSAAEAVKFGLIDSVVKK